MKSSLKTTGVIFATGYREVEAGIMVLPRLRSTGSNSLYLPHAHGYDDPDCKGAPKKLDKRLRLMIYHSFGPKHGKMTTLFVILLVACFILKLIFSGISAFIWSSRSQFPWRYMSRPNNDRKLQFPSKIYAIPDTMSTLGDKSDFYAELRKAYDTRFPADEKRSKKAVESLQNFDIDAFHPMDLKDKTLYYDIYNCPETPPSGYPFAWNLLHILEHWPANDPEPRAQIFQSLCVFDYVKDFHKARRYRDAELPFVVRGDPEVAKTVERWNTPFYLEALLGDVEHDTEYSVTNHFLYWTKEWSPPSDWKQPTQRMHMTYHDWVARANVSDTKLGPAMPHWYFHIGGCREGRRCTPVPSDYIFDELPFYQPKQNSLYVKDQNWQRGIFCRFGMKGVIAENHFDGERNFVTVLGGERRFILSHPNQCSKMSLFPMGHPSARHSAIDWSDPDLETHPEFAAATGNEVILQPGESVFIPSLWFHHIVSLSMNVQCNTRSGLSMIHAEPIEKCGYTAA